MNGLIPRKHWRLHSDLHKIMKGTHETEQSFERFKFLVREKSRVLLDGNKRKDEQDTVAWDGFLAQILEADPELAKYTDFWPIVSYWESVHRKKYHKSDSEGSQISSTNSSKKGTTSPRAYTIPNGSGSTKMAYDTKDDSNRWHRGDHSVASSHGDKAVHNLACKENKRHNDAAIASCALCEPPDSVDPWMNSGIRRLSSSDPSLLERLARIGIYLDQHLQVLSRAESNVRRIFLDSVPLKSLAKIDKTKLLNAVKKSHNNKVGYIPSPPRMAMMEIINPSSQSSIVSLRNSMQLQDDHQQFNDLWNIMVTGSCSFFQTSRPNIQDLINAIQSMVQSREEFDIYDNFWPIKLFLQRGQTVANVRPVYNTEEEQMQFIEAFIKHQSNPTLHTSSVVQIPCRYHNPVDLTLVKDTVRQKLHARGLGELIPIMLHIGVTTDEEFAAFELFSDGDKGEAINLSGVKLSHFQKFMLYTLFI